LVKSIEVIIFEPVTLIKAFLKIPQWLCQRNEFKNLMDKWRWATLKTINTIFYHLKSILKHSENSKHFMSNNLAFKIWMFALTLQRFFPNFKLCLPWSTISIVSTFFFILPSLSLANSLYNFSGISYLVKYFMSK